MINPRDKWLSINRQYQLLGIGRSSYYYKPVPIKPDDLKTMRRMGIQALQETLGRYGRPEILNTDQGRQFTSKGFTDILKHHVVKISMDGRGRCQDNLFVEHVWWSLKYPYLYLHAFDNGRVLTHGISDWLNGYNRDRGHSALDDRTPNEVYYGLPHPFAQVA